MKSETPVQTASAPASSLERMVSHRWAILCGLLLLRGVNDSPYIAAVMAEERLGKSLDDCFDAARQFLNRHGSEYPNGKWQTAERQWEMSNEKGELPRPGNECGAHGKDTNDK